MLRKILTVTGPDATVNVYRNAEWDEYVVRRSKGEDGDGYHTPDKDDAVNTAGVIAGLTEEA